MDGVIMIIKNLTNMDDKTLVNNFTQAIEWEKCDMLLTLNADAIKKQDSIISSDEATEDEKLYIDSKEPDFTKYEDFLKNEVRYSSLMKKDNKLAKELLDIQVNNAKERYNFYKDIASKNN